MDTIQHWTLDKRVQLPMVVAIVLHFGAAVWYAATTMNRIDGLEKTIIEMRAIQTARTSELKSVSERMIRLEVLLESMNEKIDEMRRRK